MLVLLLVSATSGGLAMASTSITHAGNGAHATESMVTPVRFASDASGPLETHGTPRLMRRDVLMTAVPKNSEMVSLSVNAAAQVEDYKNSHETQMGSGPDAAQADQTASPVQSTLTGSMIQSSHNSPLDVLSGDVDQVEREDISTNTSKRGEDSSAEEPDDGAATLLEQQDDGPADNDDDSSADDAPADDTGVDSNHKDAESSEDTEEAATDSLVGSERKSDDDNAAEDADQDPPDGQDKEDSVKLKAKATDAPKKQHKKKRRKMEDPDDSDTNEASYSTKDDDSDQAKDVAKKPHKQKHGTVEDSAPEDSLDQTLETGDSGTAEASSSAGDDDDSDEATDAAQKPHEKKQRKTEDLAPDDNLDQTSEPDDSDTSEASSSTNDDDSDQDVPLDEQIAGQGSLQQTNSVAIAGAAQDHIGALGKAIAVAKLDAALKEVEEEAHRARLSVHKKVNAAVR